MINTKKVRTLHTYLGYFYVGLIISFSLSGIMMNHRQAWHPDKYTIEKKAVSLGGPIHESQVNEEFVAGLVRKLGITDKVNRHNVRKDELRISCSNTDIDIELKTGKGEITAFVKTPFISHIMNLHKNNSNWWIYYSDIFALSLIIIAVTGVIMIPKGQNSFRQRGWKLALAGILFPVLFLLFVG